MHTKRPALIGRRLSFKLAVTLCTFVSIHACSPTTAFAAAMYFGDIGYSISFSPEFGNLAFTGPALNTDGDLDSTGSGRSRFDPFTLKATFHAFFGDGTAEVTTGPGAGTASSFSQATLGARFENLSGVSDIPSQAVTVVFAVAIRSSMMTSITDPLLDSSRVDVSILTTVRGVGVPGASATEFALNGSDNSIEMPFFSIPVTLAPQEFVDLTVAFLVTGAANTVELPPVPPSIPFIPMDLPNPIPEASTLALISAAALVSMFARNARRRKLAANCGLSAPTPRSLPSIH